MKKEVTRLILKIAGFLLLCVAGLGIYFVIVGFGDFETPRFMIGGFMTSFGIFGGVVLLMFGFRSQIVKASLKRAADLQKENREEIADLLSTSAELVRDAIDGKEEKSEEYNIEESMFCKHCGAKIHADSRFCKKCGKNVE